MIVATAGHVDHGKTSLVKALTQVDTDRLAEEQRRGMSIDLGFAYAEVDGVPLGFVDVPGHERFIANMLAGVAAIDLALLVVAADDGPMPQTREHLGILALLGVPRCVVALTKIDRVDAARQQAAEAEIAALLAAGPYRDAAVFPVVATGGAGVPALAAHLAGIARAATARRADGHFRLAVDRSFVVAGAGRVVTGAVLSGCVQVGDRVVVSPRGTPARVRGLQAQGRAAAVGVAGQRCALNLVGPALKDALPARGDWVVAFAADAPSDHLDVQLDALAGLPRPLAHRAALQLHLGAAAVPARLLRPGGRALDAGERGWARLVLQRPVEARWGDRFILRDPAAGRTVAGGRVIDPFGPARGHGSADRLAQLAGLAAPDAADALRQALDAAPDGIDFDACARARNLTAPEATALQRFPGIAAIATGAGVRALGCAQWQAWRDRVQADLAHWHAEHPEAPGPSEAELVGGRRSPEQAALRRAALGALEADGRVVREGLRWRLAAHRPVLAPSDAALLARIEAVLEPAGLRPPIVGDLAAQLDLPLPALLEALHRASRLGLLVRVAPNRYFLPRTVAELARHAEALAFEHLSVQNLSVQNLLVKNLSVQNPSVQNPSVHDLPREPASAGFDAAAFRDRTGIGRNLTVQVLEFLDREGVTRFDGQRRRAAASGRR